MRAQLGKRIDGYKSMHRWEFAELQNRFSCR